MLPDRKYRWYQSHVWDYGQRLAAIWAADSGNMPYGRYRGQPVAVVLRDPNYVAYLKSRWDAGLPDPPEMIAAIRRLKRAAASRQIYREQRDSCTVYRPAAFAGRFRLNP
jgi:hypothetical protein